jgi:predicted transcriptional regulator of viral defense system
MSYYDVIYEYAADNYGLITSAEAKIMDIPCGELVKLAHRGRLVRLGHGVYRVEHYIPTVLDKYAEAVTIVGSGAYIFGESVLAMHGFALVNPTVIYVATTKPIRKKLPKNIAGIIRKNVQLTHYEGIPSQSVFDALLSCRDSIMSNRLLDAVNESRSQGLITESEAKIVRKEIHGVHKSD